jgi:hypothetical protein
MERTEGKLGPTRIQGVDNRNSGQDGESYFPTKELHPFNPPCKSSQAYPTDCNVNEASLPAMNGGDL